MADRCVLSCRAPYGRGGLGRHFAEIVDAERAAGTLHRYFSTSVPAGDPAGEAVSEALAQALVRYTPARFRSGWRNYLTGELYDRRVAARLDAPCDRFVGFVGKALHSFGRVRAHGDVRLELHVGNSHVDRILRRHRRALARYPIEDSWMHPVQARKARAEYALADVIYCNSAYTRESFLEAGVPPGRLALVPLEPDARFRPPPPDAAAEDDGVFRIVYVGSLTVPKGVPLLVDALEALPREGVELTLVGRWASRGMRRWLERRLAADPRLRHAPGDPLPHYHRADVCVHPSYEDGFAYAPAEALACGVPVVVTEDTGMKDRVREGENGYVVPTGDADALADRLRHLHDRRRGHLTTL